MKTHIGMVLLLTLLLTGCEAPKQVDQLSLAYAKQPSNALTFIALDQGFFQQQGLEVQAESFPSGKRALQDGFYKKSFDMAVTADVPFSFSKQSDTELVTFAHIFSANNVNRIIARQDSGIKQIADLKGHKVATQQNSAVHFFLQRVLHAHQLSDSDIKPVFMKAEQLPQALNSGEIDAFSMREPYITQASELLDGNVNIFSAPGVYNQYELLVAHRQTLEQKPEAFEKFIKGLQQAQNFAYQHPDQATEILAKALGLPINKVRQDWRPASLQIGLQQGLLITLESEQAWLNPGLTTKSLPNVLGSIYFPVMESAAPELISIVHGK